METEGKTTKLRKRLKQLKAEVDQSWRDHWLDLSEYMLPRKGRYLSGDDKSEDNNGEKRNSKIINGASCDAIRTLAAGMQGGLTSPSRPWFRLSLPDDELMEYGPVKEWLHAVRTLMLNVFQRSNFYGSIHGVYEELGVFGTNAMMLEEDFTTIVRFRPFTVGEYYLATGADYTPNTLYRRFTMTARQMIEMFGQDKVSRPVKDAFDKNQGEKRFIVIHAIQPNNERDPASLGIEGYAFESVYFEESPGEDEKDKILRKGGYRERPFVAPRWHVTATDVYGRSPGMDALGDVKMLQKMESKDLKALDKMIDPPMVAPSSMRRHGNPNILPGGVNYIDVPQGGAGFTPAYQIQPRFQDIEYKIERVEQRIRRHFFNDMFLTIIGAEKTMTAREVAERHEEKLMMLGPVLERLQSELLDVVIGRTFNIMDSVGMLPPAPQELSEVPMRVEYISLLAQAQKMVGTSGMEQFAGFGGNLASVNPEVLDKIDFDEMVDQYADMLGVPPQIVRPDEDVAEMRQRRAQAQQQAQMMESMQQGAQGAKTLSETKMEGNSALDALMGGIGGAA